MVSRSVSSGTFTTRENGTGLGRAGFDAQLARPFSLDVLRKTLYELLEGPAGDGVSGS